ncbi:MAG: hypothetical protein NVSMB29_15610 [Candidatus Dormibacteria bacterium]
MNWGRKILENPGTWGESQRGPRPPAPWPHPATPPLLDYGKVFMVSLIASFIGSFAAIYAWLEIANDQLHRVLGQ